MAALAYAAGGILATGRCDYAARALQAALLVFRCGGLCALLWMAAGLAHGRRWPALVAAACLVKLTGGVLALAMVPQLWLRRWRELAALMAGGGLAGLLLLAPSWAHAPVEQVSRWCWRSLPRGRDGAVPFRRAQLLMSRPDQALIAVGAALGLLCLELAAARRRLHPGWGLLLLWGVGLWAARGWLGRVLPALLRHAGAGAGLPLSARSC